MQSLIHCTLSSLCLELVCPENHLENPNHYTWSEARKKHNKKANRAGKRWEPKLTWWPLVDQASKALCSWGVGQLVATGAAHLFQLWQQPVNLGHLHLDNSTQTSAHIFSAQLTILSRMFLFRDSHCGVARTHMPWADRPTVTVSKSLLSPSEATMHTKVTFFRD